MMQMEVLKRTYIVSFVTLKMKMWKVKEYLVDEDVFDFETAMPMPYVASEKHENWGGVIPSY